MTKRQRRWCPKSLEAAVDRLEQVQLDAIRKLETDLLARGVDVDVVDDAIEFARDEALSRGQLLAMVAAALEQDQARGGR